MTRPPAKATQLIDDARVRAARFDFDPGCETGWHRHGLDYVIVALTDCMMLIVHPDGSETTADIACGQSYRRDAGVEHNVINRGGAVMSFVEIELK
jgi:mannose-6-phosphate isomerase-like protein (cupin superfamily)